MKASEAPTTPPTETERKPGTIPKQKPAARFRTVTGRKNTMHKAYTAARRHGPETLEEGRGSQEEGRNGLMERLVRREW